MTLETCRICGVSLVEPGRDKAGRVDIVYECLDCGSRNVDAVSARDTTHHA
jgi:hypothetical protein